MLGFINSAVKRLMLHFFFIVSLSPVATGPYIPCRLPRHFTPLPKKIKTGLLYSLSLYSTPSWLLLDAQTVDMYCQFWLYSLFLHDTYIKTIINNLKIVVITSVHVHSNLQIDQQWKCLISKSFTIHCTVKIISTLVPNLFENPRHMHYHKTQYSI